MIEPDSRCSRNRSSTYRASVLREAVAEAVELLTKAASLVVMAGVEVHRRRLHDALAALIEHARLPIASTLTGKSVIAERHPAHLGGYQGAMSSPPART